MRLIKLVGLLISLPMIVVIATKIAAVKGQQLSQLSEIFRLQNPEAGAGLHAVIQQEMLGGDGKPSVDRIEYWRGADGSWRAEWTSPPSIQSYDASKRIIHIKTGDNVQSLSAFPEDLIIPPGSELGNAEISSETLILSPNLLPELGVKVQKGQAALIEKEIYNGQELLRFQVGGEKGQKQIWIDPINKVAVKRTLEVNGQVIKQEEVVSLGFEQPMPQEFFQLK